MWDGVRSESLKKCSDHMPINVTALLIQEDITTENYNKISVFTLADSSFIIKFQGIVLYSPLTGHTKTQNLQ